MKQAMKMLIVFLGMQFGVAGHDAFAAAAHDSITAINRGSKLILNSDLILPANASQVRFEAVYSREWTGQPGVVWCALNIAEPSVDARRMRAGYEIEFSGRVLRRDVVRQSADPDTAMVVELEIAKPALIRSLQCSGARYGYVDMSHQGWSPLEALIEDLEKSIVSLGELVLAEPIDVLDPIH